MANLCNPFAPNFSPDVQSCPLKKGMSEVFSIIKYC